MSNQETATDATTEQKAETLVFQADTCQLLHLLASAFYHKKDVFLRELISNASDALDKIRYKSLMQPSALDTNAELCIRVTVFFLFYHKLKYAFRLSVPVFEIAIFHVDSAEQG